MGWLEDIMPFTVPNAAGDARRDMEPKVAGYRGENGRFDPTTITQGLPPEIQGDADMIMKVGEARRQAVDAYRPEPLSWNKWFGGVLQEASVPIGYATNNREYAMQMMPRTILKQHQAQQTGYEDERRGVLSRINDDTVTGVGNAAMEYNKNKRERSRAAKEMVAKSIAAASARGPDAVAEATKMAAQYLRGLGMKEDADSLERMVPTGPAAAMPSQPSGPAPGGTPGVPGISVTPPQGGPAPQAGAPAGGMPQAAGPQGSGVPLSPKRRLAELVAPYNEQAAKSLLQEAEIEEAPGLEGAKQAAKEFATAEQARQTKVDNANVMAPKLGQMFDALDTYADVDGIENYTGAIEGSAAAPYTTDLINGLRPGNKASPALRDQIRGTQMALVALLKSNIRTPGEGSQDQREFQAVIDTIGDMTNANTIEDYHAKLLDSKRRVEMLTGVTIPTQRPRLSTLSSEEAGAPTDGQTPPRVSVEALKSAPIGNRREVMINGQPMTVVKGPDGRWAPISSPAEPQLDRPPSSRFSPRGSPIATR
jgi:hypothetical protein